MSWPWDHGTTAMAGFQVKSASDCLILRGLPDCPPKFAYRTTHHIIPPPSQRIQYIQLLKNSTGKTQSIIDGSAELDFFR